MSGLKDLREKFGIVSANRRDPGDLRVDGSNPKSSKKSSANPRIQYRLGAYVRLSPSDEIREEGSLVSHPQRIKSFVDMRNHQGSGWGEIVEWYTDKDMSGKDMNRPAFIRMLQDIRMGRINAVVVTELSRLSRSVKDFCQFWDFLKAHKATFFSLKENFDTSTPIGEMMVLQCITFAQFERHTIVQRLKDGARARAERGLANGSQRCMGFDPDPTRKCHLVVNSDEAEVVRLLFRKFIELGTIRKAMDFLNSNNYRTKRYTTRAGREIGGNLWTPSSIHNILSNLTLLGKREVNKKNRSLQQDELRDSDQYKIVDAAWPAIVTLEEFRRAQEILAQNNQFRRHIHVYRLTGLTDCGVCGETISGKASTGRNGLFHYYAHNRKFTTAGDTHLKRCLMERVPAVQLEELVIGRLMELAGNKEVLAQLVVNAQGKNKGETGEIDRLLASREQERREKLRLKSNLLRAIANNPDKNTGPLLDQIAAYDTEIIQIENSMSELRDQKTHEQASVIDAGYVFKLFRGFQRDFSKKPAHVQKSIIRDVVRRVSVDRDGVHLWYYGSETEEILPLPESTMDTLIPATPGESELGKVQKATHQRTPVRAAFKLVEVGGIEPPSASDPSEPLHAYLTLYIRRQTSR